MSTPPAIYTQDTSKKLPTASKMNSYDNCGSMIGHSTNCNGICCHPETKTLSPFGRLFGQKFQDDADQFSAGNWWSLFGEDLMALEQKVVAEWNVNRQAKEAAIDASIASAEARLKAERVAVRVGAMCTKRKTPIQKVAQPCKFLYNCQGTPARPTTLSVTTECWSHEYTDPATGAKIVKHVCDRMHPGEEGWLKQWNTDRNFKIVAAVRRWTENRW